MLLPKEFLVETGKEALAQLKAFASFCKRHKRFLVYSALAVLTTAIGLHLFDDSVRSYMLDNRTENQLHFAHKVREVGDFIATVVISATLLILGWLLNIRQWRRIAVAVFLGSAVAGLFVNIFRFGVGRVRPYKTDEIHQFAVGPTFSYSCHSFPSGHTGAAFGQSTALLVALPVVGVPATVFSGTVGWASMYADRHWLTDVWTAMWCGAVIGGSFGLEVRRRCKKDPPAKLFKGKEASNA